MLPRVKARMRKSESVNSGLATLLSITANATSTTTPPMTQVSTSGLPQPMVLSP